MDMDVAHDRAKKILDFFDLNDFADELDEIMCHRVSIIQKVRIVEMGRVDQLRAQAQLEHGDLEEVFLKLTGDADFAPLLDSLRGKPYGQ